MSRAPGCGSLPRSEKNHTYGFDDTVTRIKTTVDISDSLLEDAKRVAAREGTTLRALVELGLRRVIDDAETGEPFRLRDGSVDGRGMTREFSEGGWEKIRDAIYEGHGA